MAGYYTAVEMVNNRPVGRVLATGTAEEVDPYWVPGKVAICWNGIYPERRKLSKEGLASVRQKRLRRRLERKFPLFADALFEEELAKKPEFFAGERAE